MKHEVVDSVLFPTIRRWAGNKENPHDEIVVLFLDERKGIALVHTGKPYKVGLVDDDWVPIYSRSNSRQEDWVTCTLTLSS